MYKALSRTVLMVLVVVDGFVDWNLNRIRLWYMHGDSLLDFDGDVLLNGVGHMLDDRVWHNLFNRNGDFSLNWYSYRLIDRNLDGIRMRYTNENRFWYVDMKGLWDRVCNMFVVGDFYWVFFINVLSYRNSFSLVESMATVTIFITSILKVERLATKTVTTIAFMA